MADRWLMYLVTGMEKGIQLLLCKYLPDCLKFRVESNKRLLLEIQCWVTCYTLDRHMDTSHRNCYPRNCLSSAALVCCSNAYHLPPTLQLPDCSKWTCFDQFVDSYIVHDTTEQRTLRMQIVHQRMERQSSHKIKRSLLSCRQWPSCVVRIIAILRNRFDYYFKSETDFHARRSSLDYIKFWRLAVARKHGWQSPPTTYSLERARIH